MSEYIHRPVDPALISAWLNAGTLISADIVRSDPMASSRVMLLAYIRDVGELDLIDADVSDVDSDPVMVNHWDQALAILSGPSTGAWTATVRLEGRIRDGNWITLPLIDDDSASYSMSNVNYLVTVTMDLTGWDEVRATINDKAGVNAATSAISVHLNGGV